MVRSLASVVLLATIFPRLSRDSCRGVLLGRLGTSDRVWELVPFKMVSSVNLRLRSDSDRHDSRVHFGQQLGNLIDLLFS